MARISYDTFQETVKEYDNTDGGIKMFSLKNDGDEAIVRIMHDSIEDFDIITAHQVEIGGKRRKVSCIRDPREPVDNCPLCKTGAKLQQRFFIHLIVYTKNPDGSITYKPMVWERTAGEYAKKFKTLIDEYGPLSESVWKIKRNGAAKSMDTTYEVLYCNPTIYKPEFYPIDRKAFEGYTALGKIVLDRSFEDIVTFLSTGSFPQKQKSGDAANTTVSMPATPPMPTPVSEGIPTGGYVSPTPTAPTTPPPFTPPYTSSPSVPATPPTTTPEVPGPSYGGPAYGTPAAPGGRPTRYY